jgi:hypothetical protein
MGAQSRKVARLRIESAGGSPINDYRICDDLVEVRSLDASGHRFPGRGSDWKILDDNDIQLHYALETVVSKWLRVRFGTEDLIAGRAA